MEFAAKSSCAWSVLFSNMYCFNLKFLYCTYLELIVSSDFDFLESENFSVIFV